MYVCLIKFKFRLINLINFNLGEKYNLNLNIFNINNIFINLK